MKYILESRTVQYFTSSASTRKVKEKTTEKGLCNNTSSELDIHPMAILITTGTLITLISIFNTNDHTGDIANV